MVGAHGEEHAHALRAAADGCRDDAAALARLTPATTWAGLSADAFGAAVAVQIRLLHVTARELEVAADLVAAHGRAVAAATAPAAALVDLVQGLVP